MEPSYELVSTQIKTQEWDSTKVNQGLSIIPRFTLPQIALFSLPLPRPSPTSLANRHALCSQTPRGAANYQAKTRPSEPGLCPSSSTQWVQAKQLL